MGLIDNSFFFRNQNIWLTITENIFQKDMIEKQKRRLVVRSKIFLGDHPFQTINLNCVLT